jgi:hypothetical protein
MCTILTLDTWVNTHKGWGSRESNLKLLSINSKVEIKEISSVNIKKDFHLHIRTLLKQSGVQIYMKTFLL